MKYERHQTIMEGHRYVIFSSRSNDSYSPATPKPLSGKPNVGVNIQ